MPPELNTKTWHEFFLHRIFICGMGNGIDAVITTSDEPILTTTYGKMKICY